MRTHFVCVFFFFFVFVRFLRFLGAFWTDKSLSFRAKTLFLLAPGAFFLAKTLSFVFGQVFDFVFFLFIFVFEFVIFLTAERKKAQQSARSSDFELAMGRCLFALFP